LSTAPTERVALGKREGILKEFEVQTSASIEVAPGWNAVADFLKNESGDLVITKLTIEASNALSKSEGLSAGLLRAIRLREFVESATGDTDDIEFWLHATHPDYKDIRREWLKEISGDWPRVGPNRLSKSRYAKVAFFYIIELRENPISPLQSLADKMKVDKSTIARRIDSARKLGLLTRPISGSGPSGKPGGFLTAEAYEILFKQDGEIK